MAQFLYRDANLQVASLGIVKPITTVGSGLGFDLDVRSKNAGLLFTVVRDGSDFSLIPSTTAPKVSINGTRAYSRVKLQELDRIEVPGALLVFSTQVALTENVKPDGDSWSILEKLSMRLQENHALNAALDELLQALLELSRAQYGVVLTVNDHNAAWETVASILPKDENRFGRKDLISNTILTEALATKQPVLIENIIGHAYAANESIMAMRIFSLACIPLVLGDRVLGAAFLFSQPGGESIRAERLNELRHLVTQACLLVSANKRESRTAKAQLATTQIQFTDSSPMGEFLRRSDRIAPSDLNVVLFGESGTGKELIARRLHELSERRGAFVTVNCAAIPESLLESIFFGHEKGAFTGATSRQLGKFELADGGTLFLDEIGDLPLLMQSKILRAIQEREIERVGGTTVKIDVRVVAASHRDLKDMVGKGGFRGDLLYRLDGITLKVPALRERGDDVMALAETFLKAAQPKRPIHIAPDAAEALRSYNWPGNIRQLQQVVKRLAVLCDGPVLGLEDLRRELDLETEQPSLKEAQRRFTKEYVDRVLRRTDGNRQEAATFMGISERSLYRILSDADGATLQ